MSPHNYQKVYVLIPAQEKTEYKKQIFTLFRLFFTTDFKLQEKCGIKKDTSINRGLI